MEWKKYAIYWFSGHQMVFIVFYFWYIFYHLENNKYSHVMAGGLVGFFINVCMIMSWKTMVLIENEFVNYVFFSMGIFSWLASLLLMSNMNHWTSGVFTWVSILWPFALPFVTRRLSRRGFTSIPNSIFYNVYILVCKIIYTVTTPIRYVAYQAYTFFARYLRGAKNFTLNRLAEKIIGNINFGNT